ncbi:hypothetical protein FRX31_014427, partial [Thalictrum thalictroides]
LLQCFFRSHREMRASGPDLCKINNRGCWKETHAGQTYYACAVAPLLFSL